MSMNAVGRRRMHTFIVANIAKLADMLRKA